jgi:hypothetical protein
MRCEICRGSGKVSSGAGNWFETCGACGGRGGESRISPQSSGGDPKGNTGSAMGIVKNAVGVIFFIWLALYFRNHPDAVNGASERFQDIRHQALELVRSFL